MIVVIFNQSRKKSFRRTKRIVTAVLPPINNRMNIGDVPKRVLIQLVKNLRDGTTKGVSIQLFFEEKDGFRGFKCIEFGKKSNQVIDFVRVNSRFDFDLAAKGFVASP